MPVPLAGPFLPGLSPSSCTEFRVALVCIASILSPGTKPNCKLKAGVSPWRVPSLRSREVTSGTSREARARPTSGRARLASQGSHPLFPSSAVMLLCCLLPSKNSFLTDSRANSPLRTGEGRGAHRKFFPKSTV